jgi:hypothetical protein
MGDAVNWFASQAIAIERLRRQAAAQEREACERLAIEDAEASERTIATVKCDRQYEEGRARGGRKIAAAIRARGTGK